MYNLKFLTHMRRVCRKHNIFTGQIIITFAIFIEWSRTVGQSANRHNLCSWHWRGRHEVVTTHGVLQIKFDFYKQSTTIQWLLLLRLRVRSPTLHIFVLDMMYTMGVCASVLCFQNLCREVVTSPHK